MQYLHDINLSQLNHGEKTDIKNSSRAIPGLVIIRQNTNLCEKTEPR